MRKPCGQVLRGPNKLLAGTSVNEPGFGTSMGSPELSAPTMPNVKHTDRVAVDRV